MKAYVAMFQSGIWDKYIGVFSTPQEAMNALNARNENGEKVIYRWDTAPTVDSPEKYIPCGASRSVKAESRVYYSIIANGHMRNVLFYAEHAKQVFTEQRKYLGVFKLQAWEGEHLLSEYTVVNAENDTGECLPCPFGLKRYCPNGQCKKPCWRGWNE